MFPSAHLWWILLFQKGNMIFVTLSDIYFILIVKFPIRLSSVDFCNCVKIHSCGCFWKVATQERKHLEKESGKWKKKVTWKKKVEYKSLHSVFLTSSDISLGHPAGLWYRWLPCLHWIKLWNISAWESCNFCSINTAEICIYNDACACVLQLSFFIG